MARRRKTPKPSTGEGPTSNTRQVKPYGSGSFKTQRKSKKPQGPSPFLSLPRELRDQVYKEYLRVSGIGAIKECHLTRHRGTGQIAYTNEATVTKLQGNHLFLVSKAVSAEVKQEALRVAEDLTTYIFHVSRVHFDNPQHLPATPPSTKAC
ncbi:hypothetical protein EJ08DRAFT_695081 [Tothia fuscella]|uniref:Uncharacterized protein n=1 Tax=Tothia fuscella TaxID=1048955 RepID=A0A9P4U1L8_9PEZI|nr:hypothetical protein EJ08DRAFT_695081 [Tothia fuscella]